MFKSFSGPASRPLAPFLLSLTACSLILLGCGGSRQTAETNEPATETLAQAESRFNPADFDSEPLKIKEADTHGAHEKAPEIAPVKAALDTTRGYRIQVMFSADIEQATSLRDSLNDALPGQWVYLVYDNPYYKVRVGNYAERGDATEMLRTINRSGYPDAWIVPDNVILNLPPRPASVAPADTAQTSGDH